LEKCRRRSKPVADGEDRLDTNVLVRYLTWDDEWQASGAANAIEAADGLVVPRIVLREFV